MISWLVDKMMVLVVLLVDNSNCEAGYFQMSEICKFTYLSG